MSSTDEKASSEAVPSQVQRRHMSAGRYLATRFSTLKPPMNKVRCPQAIVLPLKLNVQAQVANPIHLLRLLSGQQWLFFLVGWLGCKFSLQAAQSLTIWTAAYVAKILTDLEQGHGMRYNTIVLLMANIANSTITSSTSLPVRASLDVIYDLSKICAVSLTVTNMAETFKRSNADITWGITRKFSREQKLLRTTGKSSAKFVFIQWS